MPKFNRPRRAILIIFGVIIALLGFAGPAGAAPYTDQPTISVSRQTPTAGSSIFVCGLDFRPRTRVTISLDGRRLTSTRTNRSGDFCKSVRLPRRVTGAHTIVATDRRGNSSSVAIQIQPARRDRDRDRDDDGRSAAAIRAVGVSATSALPARAQGVNSNASSDALALVGIAAIGAGALAGGGFFLFTGRRRKIAS